MYLQPLHSVPPASAVSSGSTRRPNLHPAAGAPKALHHAADEGVACYLRGVTHKLPEIRLPFTYLQGGGIAFNLQLMKGVKPHQLGGVPSFLPMCLQLVPGLQTVYRLLSRNGLPFQRDRRRLDCNTLQVKISAAALCLHRQEYRGCRIASQLASG